MAFPKMTKTQNITYFGIYTLIDFVSHVSREGVDGNGLDDRHDPRGGLRYQRCE